MITKEEYSKVNIKKVIIEISKKNVNFINVLINSLIKSINTLLLIFGIITFFLIITTIIDYNLNFTMYYQSIFNGVIEITQGLKYISILDIPLKLKCILSTFIISL